MAPTASSSPRRLHTRSRQPSQARASYRLFHEDRMVGLAKYVGTSLYYSKDGGYAWTGTPLPAQAWNVASSLRDRENKVLFSEDRVLRSDHASSHTRIVVVDDQQDTWLYSPRGKQLERIDPQSSRALWSKLTRVPNPQALSVSMREQIDHALATLHLARNHRGADLASLGVAIVGSCLAGAAWGYKMNGGVGFLGPLALSFASCWLVHRLQLAKDPHRLSRRAMIALSHRVALICASLLTALYFFAQWMSDASTEDTMLTQLKALLIVWVGCAAASWICSLLAGDLATWQCGGYPGEGTRTTTRV